MIGSGLAPEDDDDYTMHRHQTHGEAANDKSSAPRRAIGAIVDKIRTATSTTTATNAMAGSSKQHETRRNRTR
jgi:hypothetical protein